VTVRAIQAAARGLFWAMFALVMLFDPTWPDEWWAVLIRLVAIICSAVLSAAYFRRLADLAEQEKVNRP
jgi:hypothetical protein